MCDETRKKESRLSEEYNYSLLWYDARFSIWWEVDEMFRAKDDLLYVVERERERHTEKEKWMYMEKKQIISEMQNISHKHRDRVDSSLARTHNTNIYTNTLYIAY